jgi:dimethylglycine catabolism A
MTAIALSSIGIGARTAKNRIAVSAHSSGLIDANGNSDKLHFYVESRAWGGVGLFLLGETLVHDGSELAGEAWGLAVSHEGIENTYSRLANVARAHDMLLLDQLSHLGGQVWSTPGASAFAPSAIAHTISGVVPSPLDEEKLKQIEMAYVDAAKRAVDGGLDGVEIKCDQGKLLHQFLSSRYNQRRDSYGGSVEGRLVFPLRVISAVRAAVPEAFIVGVRISLFGYDSAVEAVQATKLLLKGAPFDYVSISGETNSTYTGYLAGHGGEQTPRPSFQDAVSQVRAVSNAPVMIAGKILTLKQAEDAITSGQADLVAMTRAHIADPAIVRKHIEGQLVGIRPCIECNQSCIGNTWEGRQVRCIHNVAAGREAEYSDRTVIKAEEPLRVAIIGGGPCGLEAARIAGLCGHKVDLYEANNELGGQLRSAQLRPGSSSFRDVVAFLEREVRRFPNVTLHLGTRIVDGRQAELEGAEVVLVAVGSDPLPATTSQGTHLWSSHDALVANTLRAGDRVLVVDEDWVQNGLGIAISLINKGVVPEIITTREAIGSGLNVVTLISHLSTLRSHGVQMLPLTAFAGLDDSGCVKTMDLCTGVKVNRGSYSAIVFVQNRQPNRIDLSASNARITRMMGDCVFPRGLEYAILDGNRYARI